jgi:hypothetical protein
VVETDAREVLFWGGYRRLRWDNINRRVLAYLVAGIVESRLASSSTVSNMEATPPDLSHSSGLRFA